MAHWHELPWGARGGAYLRARRGRHGSPRRRSSTAAHPAVRRGGTARAGGAAVRGVPGTAPGERDVEPLSETRAAVRRSRRGRSGDSSGTTRSASRSLADALRVLEQAREELAVLIGNLEPSITFVRSVQGDGYPGRGCGQGAGPELSLRGRRAQPRRGPQRSLRLPRRALAVTGVPVPSVPFRALTRRRARGIDVAV